MDLRNYIILLVALINIFLGVLILFKGKQRDINRTYMLLSFSVFCWCIGMIVFRASETIAISLLWCKILYAAPIFIVGSFLFFSYIFPNSEKRQKNIIRIIIILSCAIIFYITLFTNKIIGNVIIQLGTEKKIIFGNLYLLYICFISGFFTWAYIKLLKRIFSSSGTIRAQVVYVFWGSFLASGLGMVTNLILPTFGYFYFNWAGQVLSILMVGFMAYAIVVHRLMDIKLVMRRYSVYIISAVSILAVALGIKYITNLYFLEFSTAVDFLILVLAVLSYPSIKDYYYKMANKYFFSSLYDARQVISEISDRLRSTLDIRSIYSYIYKTLDNAFHVKSFGILAFNEEDGNYHVQYNKGFNIGKRKKFFKNELLNNAFIDNNESIVVEEIKSTHYNKDTKELIDLLEEIKVEIITPLNVKDKTVGLLVLGPKESGDMYNDEDLSVLKTVGAQAAIAIENALLYKESKEFGVKLTREVEKATHELKNANIKLTKLDKAKSEFISIASHQLRTPLTVIKGYISMILEGSFGKLLPEQKDSLKKVFESGERLIQLVENLLNVSRIESGRLKFMYKTMQFETIVDSVIEELEPNAKKKKLKIIYKKPKNKLPKVKIDEEKLRQVVMNLVDNAIKYTAKGKVEISLKLEKKKIYFCVNDSGMGIEKGDMLNLFKKFSRGTGTSVVHTEGTGLGLYVARQMIEAHKGKVWAESKGKGKGAKFCFLLPVK